MAEIKEQSFFDKNVLEVMTALRKKWGKNYIGIGTEILSTDYIRNSTGIFSLNNAIGGGLPECKIMMVAGKPGSSKTASTLFTVADYQRNNKKVAILNVEHGWDAPWATKLGVQLDKLLIANPSSIEQVSDTIEPLIMTGGLDLIVLDSIASISSDRELEESAEKGNRSGNAKANGVMARKITAALNDPINPVKTSVILINQIREKQNIMWGNPEYTPGGYALHHACDIIVWLRQDSKPLGEKECPLGITVNLRCTKNRTAPPFRQGKYDLYFEGRIDESSSLVELAIVQGIIQKEGYKYTFNGKTVTDIKPFIKSLTPENWNMLREQLKGKSSTYMPDSLNEMESSKLDENLEGTV
jgi:recombination protein RecA